MITFRVAVGLEDYTLKKVSRFVRGRPRARLTNATLIVEGVSSPATLLAELGELLTGGREFCSFEPYRWVNISRED